VQYTTTLRVMKQRETGYQPFTVLFKEFVLRTMQWYVGSDARESFLSGLFQSVYTKRNVLISRTDVKQRQNVP